MHSKASVLLFAASCIAFCSPTFAADTDSTRASAPILASMVTGAFAPQVPESNPANRLLHKVGQCETNCQIVYNHCDAVGAGNCENKYRACMNAC